MKKYKFIIGVIGVVAIGASVFFACEKENNFKSNVSDDIVKSQKAMSPGDKAQIIGADLTGMLTGGAAGATIGNAIGGPVGAATGATIGGVIGGVGSSLAKWGQLKAQHDSVNQNVSETTMSHMKDEAGNNENPYDSVGLIHYQLVHYYIENESLYEIGSEFDSPTYYANAMELFPQYYTSINITDFPQYFPYSTFLNVLNDSELPLEQLLNECIENPNLKNMLLLYDQERINSADFSVFYTYSIAMEHEVLNSSFSAMDKQLALSYMATARYGSWFWGLICELN